MDNKMENIWTHKQLMKTSQRKTAVNLWSMNQELCKKT